MSAEPAVNLAQYNAESPVSSFRQKRFSDMLALIDRVLAEKSEVSILDIGGTHAYWLGMEPMWRGRNLKFTLLNLEAEPVDDPRFESRSGNACAMPEIGDLSFDIAHSNSVIEHVGRWDNMSRMAREIWRVAPRFLVQTPAFEFPIEPHFRTAFFHWLPEPMRIMLTQRFALGHYPRAENLDQAIQFVEDAILLDETRFRALFPEPARLVKERFLGLTKSYTAIKD